LQHRAWEKMMEKGDQKTRTRGGLVKPKRNSPAFNRALGRKRGGDSSRKFGHAYPLQEGPPGLRVPGGQGETTPTHNDSKINFGGGGTIGAT